MESHIASPSIYISSTLCSYRIGCIGVVGELDDDGAFHHIHQFNDNIGWRLVGAAAAKTKHTRGSNTPPSTRRSPSFDGQTDYLAGSFWRVQVKFNTPFWREEI
jgi:hypothetical protein